jgi:hypothetical protein
LRLVRGLYAASGQDQQEAGERPRESPHRPTPYRPDLSMGDAIKWPLWLTA